MNLLGAQNKDIRAAAQTSLTRVRLRMLRRLRNKQVVDNTPFYLVCWKKNDGFLTYHITWSLMAKQNLQAKNVQAASASISV